MECTIFEPSHCIHLEYILQDMPVVVRHKFFLKDKVGEIQVVLEQCFIVFRMYIHVVPINFGVNLPKESDVIVV